MKTLLLSSSDFLLLRLGCIIFSSPCTFCSLSKRLEATGDVSERCPYTLSSHLTHSAKTAQVPKHACDHFCYLMSPQHLQTSFSGSTWPEEDLRDLTEVAPKKHAVKPFMNFCPLSRTTDLSRRFVQAVIDEGGGGPLHWCRPSHACWAEQSRVHPKTI